MSLTISSGIELRLGTGLHQFRFNFHGPRAYLIRLPFLGKAWSYGSGGSGYTSWAEVRADHARGCLED